MIKRLLKMALPLIDVVLVFPVLAAGFVMQAFRRIGVARLPRSNACLLWI